MTKVKTILMFCLLLQATDGKETLSDEVYGEHVSTPVYAQYIVRENKS